MRYSIPSIATIGVLWLNGCVPTTPHWDEQFGYSTQALLAQQLRNPDASQANADRPVDGIDGRAARGAMDRYPKSYAPAEPQPYNVITLGVGGAQGGSR